MSTHPSLHERFAFLAQQRAEHARHTARLAEMMREPVQACARVHVLTHQEQVRRLRVAYTAGVRSGMCNGVLAGVIVGLGIALLAVLLGAGRLLP